MECIRLAKVLATFVEGKVEDELNVNGEEVSKWICIALF